MYISETSRSPLTDNLDALLRKSLKLAMLSRGINEEKLAAELTQRLGCTVRPCLVSAWKAEQRHRWHLPANLVPVICEILGDDSIQRLLLSDKLSRSLELGESTARVISLLHCALAEGSNRKAVGKPRRQSKR
jgi:hypothetical protein